jgi:hypothetical protein
MLDMHAVTRSAQVLRPGEDAPGAAPTPRPGPTGGLHPAGPFSHPATQDHGPGLSQLPARRTTRIAQP